MLVLRIDEFGGEYTAIVKFGDALRRVEHIPEEHVRAIILILESDEEVSGGD